MFCNLDGECETIAFEQECNYDEELVLKGYSLQEAYLLLTTFNFNYRDAGPDDIPNLNSNEKKYGVEINKLREQMAQTSVQS